MNCVLMREKVSGCVMYVCDDNDDAVVKCLYVCNILKLSPEKFEIKSCNIDVSFFIAHNFYKLEKDATIKTSMSTLTEVYNRSNEGGWHNLPEIDYQEYKEIARQIANDECLALTVLENSDIF